MIDDMAPLKQAMAQMDAEDPEVAQTAKDRAAQILSEDRLNFSKMAELIERRQLLLRPMIVTRIKRMDQPGMLGDAAFRDTGSALRREGQSFLQIAEAIEHTGGLAPRYDDLAQNGEPPRLVASEPAARAGPGALEIILGILLFPWRNLMRILAIAFLALVLFYGWRGFVALGQQVSGYFDSIAAVRQGADKVISSVSSLVNGQNSQQSKEAPPTPPAPIPPPPAGAPSPPPATASAPPPGGPAPSASESPPPAPSPAAPTPPSTAAAGPPVSKPRRDARGERPSKSVTNCDAPPDDLHPWSCCCAPLEDDRPLEGDRPSTFFPSALKAKIPEGIRRNSPVAGPCIGGVGGCYWGGGQY
jgi:hypothetical protein